MQKPGLFDQYAEELSHLPSDLSTIWRREGLRGFGASLWARASRRLFHWGRRGVYTQDLRYTKQVDPPAGVTITRFEGPDWSPFEELVTSRLLDRFKRAVEVGRFCSVAWRGNQIIGYLISSDVIEPEIEFYDLKIPPNGSYGWALYVVPAERNNGIGTALVSARLQHALERGRDVSWRIVEESNLASKATWRKTAQPGHGVEYQGELRWIKIWRYSRFRFIPADPP